MVNSMMSYSELSGGFWGEAVGEAVNESFDPHYGNYIELNDLDIPLEPRMNNFDASGRTYQAFDNTLVGSSQFPYQRRTTRRTGDASTSVPQQPDP
ncbi:hypothetical protein Tco_0453534 [Tanacetum coccineum]